MRECDVRSASDALAYLLDCQLATVAGMALKKTKGKFEFERQISIAQKNLEYCLSYGADLQGTRAIDIMKNFGNGMNAVQMWAESFQGGPK